VRRRLESGQHHQAGRLAGTRRAQHCQKLAARDVEVQILYDENFAVIALLNVDEPDNCVIIIVRTQD